MYQSEHKKLFAATPTQIITALLHVLPKLGWEKLEAGDCALMAQLIEDNESNWFTSNFTCIPCGDETELLLTLSTNHSDSLATKKAQLILNELQNV